MGWRLQLAIIRFGNTNYNEFGRVVKGQFAFALGIGYLTFDISYGIMPVEQLNISMTLLSREAEGPAL